MPNKKKTKKEQEAETPVSQAETPQEPSPEDELEQLRHIVFGAARQQLTEYITAIHNELKASLNTLEQKFTARLDKMQENIEQQFSQLDHRIQLLDKIHDDTEADLQKSLEGLASEHEMLAAATEQDFKKADQSLNDETASLTHSFNEKLKQLEAHLEDVSKELSSSKTDRKTLAKLLATMATNLEDDQL